MRKMHVVSSTRRVINSSCHQLVALFIQLIILSKKLLIKITLDNRAAGGEQYEVEISLPTAVSFISAC